MTCCNQVMKFHDYYKYVYYRQSRYTTVHANNIMRGGIKSLVKEHCNLDHTCFTVYIIEKFLKFQDNNGQPAVFLIICRLLLGKLFELLILRHISLEK